MKNHQQTNQPAGPVIVDAEWMMIHCDTFVSERERIQQKEKAFVIDRDLHGATGHLPNENASAKGVRGNHHQAGDAWPNEYLNL